MFSNIQPALDAMLGKGWNKRASKLKYRRILNPGQLSSKLKCPLIDEVAHLDI
jgi:hypothetical protein